MLMELPKTPIVNVHTTENRGFTPEEVAKRCADKIVEVGDNAAPEIRDQANSFNEAKASSYLVLQKLTISGSPFINE